MARLNSLLKKADFGCGVKGKRPSGPKGPTALKALTYGLKPVPFKTQPVAFKPSSYPSERSLYLSKLCVGEVFSASCSAVSLQDGDF
jgi:hypothetical protein